AGAKRRVVPHRARRLSRRPALPAARAHREPARPAPRDPRAAMSDTRPARLTAHQARLLHLAAQGLLVRPRRRARKRDVLAAIESMRVLQIDTIHVVARSPSLVLFSRLGDYEPRWLDALLAEGRIFECWAHEACFAPFADYALH